MLRLQFFSLLRSGLWNSPLDSSLFESADWDAIFDLANKQTVAGIIYDAVIKLPIELQAPAALMRKWYMAVVRIMQSHELLNQRLAEIIPLLQSEGIHPVLLKGQGVAQNYPNPARRQCGDIDLYIGGKDYKKACDIVLKYGIVSGGESESVKHYHFNWNGVTIELHRIAEQLYSPLHNMKFQRWTKQHLSDNKLRIYSVNDTDVPLPPVNFDTLYIFNHFYRHFIAKGIGLRQVCDWTLYIHTFNDRIDMEMLKKDLKAFGLLRVWQIFGNIAVNKLGLPQNQFPFYTDKYKSISCSVLDNMLQDGNFGFYKPKNGERPAGYIMGKLYSFKNQHQRVHSLPIAFKEKFTYYIFFFFNGVKQIIKDFLKIK